MSNVHPLRALEDIAHIVMGQSPASAFVHDNLGKGMPFLQGCSEFGPMTPVPVKSCTGGGKRALKGASLISVRAPVGALNKANCDYIIGRGLAAISARAHVSESYLGFALQYCSGSLRRVSQGSTFEAIGSKELRELQVPVPESLNEQQSIAAVLCALDEQIEQTEKLVAKQKNTLTGLLQDLLPEGFAVDHTPENTLADALRAIESGKSFMCSDKPAEQGQWGVLKVSAVRPEGFDCVENKAVVNLSLVQEQYEVTHGDLLITRANTAELVGAACLVDSPRAKLLLCDKTLRLCPRPGVSSAYLWLWLQTPVARKHIDAHATGTSAGMKNISQSAIRSMPIHMPDLSAQTARTEPVIAQLELLRALKEEIAKLHLQKQGLMHDLLTGLTRV